MPLGKAPGPDGIPHELWKRVAKRYKDDEKAGREAVNIVKILKAVFNDIEKNGIDETTNFSAGWMCPIYKKGDKREISNYRPITVLNSDYKTMTRILTTRLARVAPKLIHLDQAGFMTGRRIEDQTDLVQLMIEWCEAYSENGAVVCLDQEKAYDKIRHDFIWETLRRLNFPDHFLKTVQTLYGNGKTCVIINGVISDYYAVIRGLRQGDPLSCLIFNLAIESLACMLRKSDLKGFKIPGSEDSLITTLFADDTTIYLNERDSFEMLQNILRKWCRVSGAKFNVPKTAVIPLGSSEYRQHLIETRKLGNNAQDPPIPHEIRISNDGEATRVLGAQVGNKIGQPGLWTPILEKIDKRLERWLKGHPTQNGKRLILGMEVGGLTQYFTRVQGMPKAVEEQITQKMSNFFWEGRKPTVNYATLTNPIEHGGKNMLNLECRNEAIDLMRLKTYIRDDAERPKWAYVADEIIKKHINHHPQKVHSLSAKNILLQSWETMKRGEKALPNTLLKLTKIAKKYGASPGDPLPTAKIVEAMPIWHHRGFKKDAKPRNNDIWADCQRTNHRITLVSDMAEYTKNTPPNNHIESLHCICEYCTRTKNMECTNPHKCLEAGKRTLNLLAPRWKPQNITSCPAYVREENEYDKNVPQSRSPLESIRIFGTAPDVDAPPPPEPYTSQNQTDDVNVFINSVVKDRGQETQKAYAGIYYSDEDPRNCKVSVEGESQTKQSAEVVALIHLMTTTHPDTHLRLHFATESMPNLLLHRVKKWEIEGWTNHANNKEIRLLINKMRARGGKVILEGPQDNLNKEELTEAHLLANSPRGSIPPVNVQGDGVAELTAVGAKLAEQTQSSLYRLILNKKGRATQRRAATTHLDMIRHAVQETSGTRPNDLTIWKNTSKNPTYTHRHKAFLWRAIHNSYKIGTYWDTIPGYEHRGQCRECGVTETMEHILTECRVSGQETIWNEAGKVWDRRKVSPWRKPKIGDILGSGIPKICDEDGKKKEGATRFHMIILSESAQFIWRNRCKWRIAENSDPLKLEREDSLRKAWINTMNRRLHLEILQTNTFRYGNKALKTTVVDKTWRCVLKDSEHVQDDWINNWEGLVGIG